MTLKRIVSLSFVAVAVLVLQGCSSTSKSSGNPYAPASQSARNPIKAQELTMHAVEAMDAGNADEAERLLRAALTADLYHGPAHNNLGVLYLKQRKRYEAAGEFEWARKLMPGHPDPRMNLALTLKRAGRIDEALETYATALEVYPNHIPTLQAICRCQLRFNKTDELTDERLSEIALRGETPQWREWAKQRLISAAVE